MELLGGFTDGVGCVGVAPAERLGSAIGGVLDCLPFEFGVDFGADDAGESGELGWVLRPMIL